MVSKIFLLFPSLAVLAHGHSLGAREELSVLMPRQGQCDPGETQCSARYCAPVGWKCCNGINVAPLSAICCPGGSYAELGNYCCSNGRSCPNGGTCRGCTRADGTGPISAFPSQFQTMSAPRATITSVASAPPTRRYFTYTITYYYWQFYYIYVQSLSRSTATSSTVATTTIVSVFAENSAEAQASFDAFSATIALPTPASATVLPPLPSQTSALALPSPTSSARDPTNTRVASPLPSQFEGKAGRPVGDGSIVVAWVVASVMGLGLFGPLML